MLCVSLLEAAVGLDGSWAVHEPPLRVCRSWWCAGIDRGRVVRMARLTCMGEALGHHA